MIGEIKRVTSLDAQKIAIDAAFVAIVATHNLHSGICSTHAQSSLAAISAMCARGAHVLHFPGTSLVSVCARGQRTHGADVNAHAAFFAFEMIFSVGSDNRAYAAILHAQRPHIHSLAANSYAAIAKNAARPVEIHHRRPLLLVPVLFRLHVLRFSCSIRECHVLQFALTTGIAHRTIKRMISQQQFDHALASLMNLRAVGCHRHAFGNDRGAGSLQLGHLLDLHQAHAACTLQREIRVITKRWHLDAHTLAGFDQKRPRRRCDLLSVDGDVYVSHGD